MLLFMFLFFSSKFVASVVFPSRNLFLHPVPRQIHVIVTTYGFRSWIQRFMFPPDVIVNQSLILLSLGGDTNTTKHFSRVCYHCSILPPYV